MAGTVVPHVSSTGINLFLQGSWRVTRSRSFSFRWWYLMGTNRAVVPEALFGLLGPHVGLNSLSLAAITVQLSAAKVPWPCFDEIPEIHFSSGLNYGGTYGSCPLSSSLHLSPGVQVNPLQWCSGAGHSVLVFWADAAWWGGS